MEAEIAIAGPRAVEKNSKVIDTCSSMVKDAVEKMEEAKLAGTDPSNEALQVAYETTCVVRLRMLQIWQAPSLEAIPEQRPLPSKPGKSGSSSDPTAQPAIEAGASASVPKESQSPDEKKGAGDANQPATSPKAGSVKAPAENASAAASSGKKLSNFLVKELNNAGPHAQLIKEPSHVLVKVHMEEIISSLMDCKTVEELSRKVTQLKNGAAVVKELKDGANKATTSLKSHISARARAASRKRLQEQKNAEQTEVKKSRKQAKDAAEKIKEEEQVVHPVFKTDWQKLIADGNLEKEHAVTEVDGPSKDSLCADQPYLIKNLTALADFQKNPKAIIANQNCSLLLATSEPFVCVLFLGFYRIQVPVRGCGPLRAVRSTLDTIGAFHVARRYRVNVNVICVL